MKKIYLFTFLFALFSFTINAQINLEDDFESYNIGDLASQADHWRTWSGTPGGDEDADVIIDYAYSGSQSMTIDGSEITDQLLLIPDNPTTGTYTVQWFMYIPASKSGYFNMQAASTADGAPWAQALMGGNVYFNCDGTTGGVGGVTGVIDCSTFDQIFTYPENEWFKVTCIYDLDAQTWSMNINDVSQFTDHTLAFGTQVFQELAAINFYSASANNEIYIDDVTLATGILSTNSFDSESFTIFPNPVVNQLNIQSKEAVNTVSIYNVLGKLVHQSSPNTISPSIDMATYKSGIYFVEVTIGNARRTVKVVK